MATTETESETSATAWTCTRGSVAAKPVTSGRVLRGEWVKTRSLRSTWLTATATLVVILGMGLLAARMTPSRDLAGPAQSPLDAVLAGANLAVLIVAVWGSVAGGREFSTGMIRTTLSAVPKRLPVLWGKIIAFAAVTVPTVLAGVLVAFVAGMAILSGGGAAVVGFGDDGVAGALFGTVYYISGLGVIGLALGVLLRNTAAAIGTVIGAVLFLPALAGVLLPDSWSSTLKYLPSNAGQAFTGIGQSTDLLTSTQGLMVFTAWIAVAVAGAAAGLTRRDA